MQEMTLQQENTALKNQIVELLAINKRLLDEVAWLKRQIFGQKTERFIPGIPPQTELPLNLPPASVPPPETIVVPAHERIKNKNANHPGRDEIPAHIPRVVIDVKPDFDITGCEKIGEKIVERLEYTPPKFFVNKYICPVFRTVVNSEATLLNTPAPVLCIEKGKLGASIVAHTMLSKCEDHLPLYRIAKMLSRDAGDVIAESTLRDAFAHGAFLIEAIVHRMREIAFTSKYLQMDESVIKVVIKPSNGKSHQGYMIVSHAPQERILLFDYRHTRNIELVKKLLGGFSGILQTDGLELYSPVCKELELQHAGDIDHCRRGFERAQSEHKIKADWALRHLQKLYAVEQEARDAELAPDARHTLRQKKSKPIFDEFIAWCNNEIVNTPPKNLLGKAINYTLNRIDELGFFLSNGLVEMTTIRIENGIRPLAVGRKNFMITGSEAAAQRLATIYSIVGTCYLHGINTRDYLGNVLNVLPARMSNNIDDLLPWNWGKPQDKDLPLQ